MYYVPTRKEFVSSITLELAYIATDNGAIYDTLPNMYIPNNARLTRQSTLPQHSRQNHNRKHNRQNQQQTTSLIPRIPLMPTRDRQLPTRTLRIVPHALHILTDNIQLLPLLVHHVRHIPEQLVEFADGLLDVADFGFALDDEGFLEVDFGLRGQAELVLFLLLLALLVVRLI